MSWDNTAKHFGNSSRSLLVAKNEAAKRGSLILRRLPLDRDTCERKAKEGDEEDRGRTFCYDCFSQ